jgi:subtilisin family serine protease
LKNDSRVLDVQPAKLGTPIASAIQTGTFDKTQNHTGEHQNYGLIRHTSATNVFGTSNTNPGNNYNYVLDGTGVDVVIMDSGIEKNHPEFQNSEGVSRVQEIDWFTTTGITGSIPENHYTDTSGHGTHVASIAAGKTFGWAKNANIYVLTILDNDGKISETDAFDVLLAWHNAKTNGRPTVVNMSWGYAYKVDLSSLPRSVRDVNNNIIASIDGTTYRGVANNDSARADLISKGLIGQSIGNDIYHFPYYSASLNADVEQLIDAGIHVSVAAGNYSMKQDVVSGVDYDNVLRFTYNVGSGYSGSSSVFYHRGSSPNVAGASGFTVGAIAAESYDAGNDQKANYSDAGPGVNIFAVGSNVIGAMSNTIPDTRSRSVYSPNTNYWQSKLSGTSMASPQIAGMVCLLLQIHPDWTPTQVVNWVFSNSTDKIFDGGDSTGADYTTERSLWGAYERLAYFPLKGSKVFQYTSS